jgi:hypothetical protein
MIFICEIDAIMTLYRLLSGGSPAPAALQESAWSFTCDLPVPSPQGPQALRHPADLPDSSWSDSSRGAPDSEVFSVGPQEGVEGGVVSRGGVIHRGRGFLLVLQETARRAPSSSRFTCP